MTGSDWVAIFMVVLEWFWDHRNGVATLIALTLLAGILNFISAIAYELYFIRELMKDRISKRE